MAVLGLVPETNADLRYQPVHEPVHRRAVVQFMSDSGRIQVGIPIYHLVVYSPDQ